MTNPTGNRAPNVEVGALPLSGDAPLEVLLTAEGTDPDGDTLARIRGTSTLARPRWAVVASFRYCTRQGGTCTASLAASNGRGGTDTAEIPIVVGIQAGDQARQRVTAAADPKAGTAPLTVDFSSHAVDPDGSDLLVTWAFGDGGQARRRLAPRTPFCSAGTCPATVTAMDPTGATGTATVQVVVSAP